MNRGLIRASMNGELLYQIAEKQMADLKNKAGEIPFITLAESKKAFDEKSAVFLDSRSPGDYRNSHIQNARLLPLVSLIQNKDLADKTIPDKTARYIIYCDGEGCDLSVELAKELISLGYAKVEVLGEGYPGWADAGYSVQSSQ